MMDELEEELRANDKEEFAGRLSRFREIVAWLEHADVDISLGSDFETGQAFQDARFSYVAGYWLAAIVTAQTAVERHLAWRLSRAGVKGAERLTAQNLANQALSMHMITKNQASDFERLRAMRNDFAHYRIESRFWKTVRLMRSNPTDQHFIQGLDMNSVLQADAKEAIYFATVYFLSTGSHPGQIEGPKG